MNATLVGLENPWTRLSRAPPFVLPEDAAALREFNGRAKPEHRVDTTLLPEPFVGRLDAPVVVLCLNPGWHPSNAVTHSDPGFVARSRANLAVQPARFPFFPLDPACESLGLRWWRRKLRRLIEATSLETVANGVLCVEYFPYHSHRYGSRVPRLRSQEFSFDLVRAAMEREAVIVVMRSVRRWEAAIPELASYARRVDLVNPQNPCISPRNCPDGFAAIVAALRSEG